MAQAEDTSLLLRARLIRGLSQNPWVGADSRHFHLSHSHTHLNALVSATSRPAVLNPCAETL